MIHNYSGEPEDFSIDEFHFKTNHHPFYIFEENKNAVKIMREISPLDEEEVKKVKRFTKRIDAICTPNEKVGLP